MVVGISIDKKSLRISSKRYGPAGRIQLIDRFLSGATIFDFDDANLVPMQDNDIDLNLAGLIKAY